ncbi:two-component system regulatory protein YycI [Vaginisenegalia massiliensis]|uniref:two-component system regulatory protein YycI n=1 Tax=Vaginisenegalia massiliensis TaxID=2058294 RepID=UPI0013DD977E|nr:two-component system regulatory protein YycI [Vaginisenegalia massiliensis]
MDFKRIQVLLVLIFFLFNCYLVTQLYNKFNYADQVNTTTTYTNIEDDLKGRNISLSKPLDADRVHLPIVKAPKLQLLQDNLGQLKNQKAVVDANGTLNSTFNAPVDLGVGLNNQSTGLSKDQAQIIRDNFLKNGEMFLFGDQYTHWWYIPSSRLIIFRMSAYDGKAIVDGSADLRIQLDQNYQMVSYSQNYQTNFYALEQPIQLISAKEAVTFLDQRIETYLPNDSKIQHIGLTYFRYMATKDFSIFSPAWEIIYYRSDGVTKSMLVDAIRGQVLNHNPGE